MKQGRQLSNLDKAIAGEAHLGQLDKAGHPYLLHPLRLLKGSVLKGSD